MQDLPSTIVASVPGTSLSLAEFFQTLGRSGRLKSLLVRALAEKRILEAARRDGLTITDAELQQASDRRRRHLGLIGAAQTTAWLAEEGLTLDDFEAGLERDLLLSRFETRLDQARVAEHFAAHADRYARTRLGQLVVASEGSARELLTQMEEGQDFADLARTHSLHEPSGSVGGGLGVVCRADLPSAVADVVFAARPGTVVGPIVTDRGITLFHVEALLPAELDEATTARIRKEMFDAWLREQLAEVRIDLGWLDSPK